MKRNKFIALSVALLSTSPLILSCTQNEKPLHEHAFYPVEAKEASCVSTGNIAYDQCIYCKEIRVNNEIKTLEDVTLAIDPAKHLHLVEHELIPSTCTKEGTKAHSYCEDCQKYLINGEIVEQTSLTLPLDLVNGHTYEHFDEIPATCVDGRKAYDFCTTCNKYFINGKETTLENLTIPSVGNHSFKGDELLCENCKVAYRFKDSTGAYHTFDSKNNFAFTPIPSGITYEATKEIKEKALQETLENRMSFGIQNPGLNNATITTNGSTITIQNKSARASFGRFALGEGKTPYIGRALISFNVKFKDDVNPSRIGLKVVDSTATVISGEGVNQDKLLGTKNTEENNANRKLIKDKEYTFIYEVNVTDATQMLQLFADFPATTLEISNLHFIKLNTPSKNVTSSLLYFGASDLSKDEKPGTEQPDPEIPEEPQGNKTYKLFNGDNFFSPANWYGTSDTTPRDDKIIKDGKLEFTSQTASRYDFFYSTKGKAIAHLGDNGSKFLDEKTKEQNKEVLNTPYKYDFTIKATDEFDMMILGNKASKGPSDNSQSSFFLNIAKGGKISLSQGSSKLPSVNAFTKKFSGTSSFDSTKENKLSLEINRVSAGKLTLKVFVNDTQVKLAGETLKGDGNITYSVDANGTFTSENFFTSLGMGQRLGIYPSTNSTVTISDLKVTPEPSQK